MTTTLDHVSGGRMILGIGAGWFAREHEAFGFDFGTGFGERLDRLGEAVPLIRRLLDGETVTHEGRFYRFDDAVCAPRPVQDRVSRSSSAAPARRRRCRWSPGTRTCGTPTASPDELAASDAILRAACEAVGRDEREIERTVNVNVVIRPTRAEAERAWAGWMAATGRRRARTSSTPPARWRRWPRAAPPRGRGLRAPGAGLPDAVRPRDHRAAARAAGGAG